MKKTLLILSILPQLFFPKLNFGQAPDLGTASTFAAFTAVGAFSNLGASTVTGDVGTNVGEFTGMTSATLIGQIHIADATSAQAATDVNTAYSFLNGISCDSVIGVTLGNGQILTPKVYCIGSAASLNGDLTLDAQGDPDAVFIFKIDGALSTATLSNIILINSAASYNVYWQINGAVELNDNSVFKGTIIANGAISLMEGTSLFGRALSRAGAISLHNNIVTIDETPLPIELLNFNAHKINSTIHLDWTTVSEINNDYFTVQQSADGIYFKDVLRIQGAGNSNAILNYSAIDYNAYERIIYYRLRQTDFDGKFSYSNIIALDFTFYPSEIKIYNVSGVELYNSDIKDLPSGIYFYTVISNNKIIQSRKIISQN